VARNITPVQDIQGKKALQYSRRYFIMVVSSWHY
jgi:hypothetical protein